MAMLYTINFEYKGGTYLAQVQAPELKDVLRIWLEQVSDTELAEWKADRSSIAETFISEAPVALRALKGVWCVASTINNNFALANIIATDAEA